ncbi:MAG: flavodoxin domain-containing protein [Nitrososphaerota archaeon]|nr:flavodoxin domain-containing protein [Candidatus Bathyarchaeota archaeon]MDW8023705.1 flavodoxin domain-containing protein [Nitrososphaerota archaeon]
MPKVLIIYDSLTGNTARAAGLIAEGAESVEGVDVEIRKVDAVSVKEIEEAASVILGCPTHGFTASKKMKDFLSRLEVREALKGKNGAIFASCRIVPSALKWLEKTLKGLDFKLMGKLAVRGSPKGEKECAFRNLGRKMAEYNKSQRF